jgi:alanine racemase
MATDFESANGFASASLAVRLGAIAANYKNLKRRAGPAITAAVVKADGYGLGATMTAPALVAAGCDTFFVAQLAEGIALRPHLPKARIFVLEGATQAAVPALLANNLIPVLNSLPEIAVWTKASGKSRGALQAAIHIDTGLNRLGLRSDELSTLASEWRTRLAGLDLVLLMSHLACADDLGADAPMNLRQLERFRAALAMLPPAPASLAATSGIFLGADYRFDLVRPGIGLWGGGPPQAQNPMKNVAVLTARVLQIRRIDKGDTVGYAATFRAKRPTMLATVALGYADGIMRTASNKGAAAFAGVRAPFAGRVSMDLLTLDVTDLKRQPAIGDTVELLGDTMALRDVAASFGTNEYELLTGFSHRIARRYTDAAA